MKTALLLLALALPVMAATTLSPESPALSPDSSSPAKEALELFRSGRHTAAVEAAGPLAEKGNADALFLLGFASETGQGIEASREKALDYYRRAAEAKHEEATYRRALILLNSEKEEERKEGREALENAAKEDPGNAGRILGEAWLRGSLSEKPDFDKGVEWWTRSADAGDTTSLILLARLYTGEFGFEDKADAKKAIAFYQKAADLGDRNAWLPLGSRLLNGDEETRDEAKGREWIKKATDDEQLIGWLALGDFEENQKKDNKAAYAAYLKGADAGQPDCMLALARFHYQGLEGEKDEKKGRDWLDKAATAGSGPAHLELARLLSGEEKPDTLKIYSHLVTAASTGIPAAQNELGLLYLSDRLGAADAPAAAAWFTRAARSGFAASQNNLATLYERGVGVEPNLQNAGELYTLAANQGHPEATGALARLFARGIGTAQNLTRAWALATLALERGDEGAREVLGEISPNLTPELLVAAKKELEEMKKPADEKAEDKDKGEEAAEPAPAENP